jgi:hypothetical protein
MKNNSSHRQGREKKKPGVEDDVFDPVGRMGKRQAPVEKVLPPPPPPRTLTPRPCPFQHSRNVVCPMCDGLDV